MDSNPLDHTSALLDVAKSSLHNLLQAKETHWKQKPRVKWLKEGNPNTKFFHLSAKMKIRGSSNMIDRITFDGRTLVDPQEIKEAATRFFTAAFQAPQTSVADLLF